MTRKPTRSNGAEWVPYAGNSRERGSCVTEGSESMGFITRQATIAPVQDPRRGLTEPFKLIKRLFSR